jgi:membrane-bound lytic murein transglycosylase D
MKTRRVKTTCLKSNKTIYAKGMRKFLLIVFTFAFFSQTLMVWGITPNSPIGRKKCSIIQNLDSLKALEFPLDSPKYNQKGNHPIPIYPDLVYEVKIAALGYLSPIHMDFNEYVKKYIDIYTIERRDQVSQLLALSELYFPLFDEILDKHQLPLELKYLAVVESALNPLAVSVSGAVGLWQFKINTGRMFDLEVNSYIDERMDPVKSTEAASMYLKYLYRIFNDWHLVMAAYNVGPGVVRNTIFRAGGETNFWKIHHLLPEAAQNYVPAFIAAAYVMNHPQAHKISPADPAALYMQTDTVKVSEPLSLNVLASELDIPFSLIRFLNPTFRRGVVPKDKRYNSIRLPLNKVQEFLRKESILYEKTPDKLNFHDILAKSGSTENRIKLVHKVQAGDYLHKIAVRYNCTVDDITIWNPKLSSDLAIDQTIIVWVDEQTYELVQLNVNGF